MPKLLSSNDQLIEQEDAVGMYLSALLIDEVQENTSYVIDNYTDIIQQQDIVETKDEIQDETLTIVDKELTVTDDTSKDQTKHVIPEFLNSGFQALSFRVSNIKLCVPLQQLNGIIEWNGGITRLPGQASWCVGIMRTRGRNVSVVDLSGILHNTSSNGLVSGEPGKKSVQYVLLVGNGKWGLSCDSVNNISTLYADDINWRTCGADKLIMGTVVEHMNLVLNVDEFVRRLENSSFSLE